LWVEASDETRLWWWGLHQLHPVIHIKVKSLNNCI
jgi:hypothetical protein